MFGGIQLETRARRKREKGWAKNVMQCKDWNVDDQKRVSLQSASERRRRKEIFTQLYTFRSMYGFWLEKRMHK